MTMKQARKAKMDRDMKHIVGHLHRVMTTAMSSKYYPEYVQREMFKLFIHTKLIRSELERI